MLMNNLLKSAGVRLPITIGVKDTGIDLGKPDRRQDVRHREQGHGRQRLRREGDRRNQRSRPEGAGRVRATALQRLPPGKADV